MKSVAESERVLILDFGSQYGQLIARRVRELNVFCQIVRHDLPATRIAELMRRAAGRIEVLPAGGINRFTVADVLARTGCDQVHASLRAGAHRSSRGRQTTIADVEGRSGTRSPP